MASSEFGELAAITMKNDDVLIFVINRYSDEISPTYLAQTKEYLKRVLPEGKEVIIIGKDVDIMSIHTLEATLLMVNGTIKP